MAWAIQRADEFIDNSLRMSPYEVPFVDPPPVIIEDISTRLAGVELYESRMMVDAEDIPNPVMHHKEKAMKMIAMIQAGQLHLDSPRVSDVTYPTVEREDRSPYRTYT